MSICEIKPREHIKHTEWRRSFTNIKHPDSGFEFPCDSSGTLIHNEHYDCWIENYEMCISNPEKFRDDGVVKRSWWHTEPALVRCSCGEEFYLDGDTECPNCGQWYNGFGQELKDPSQWEEDW